MLRLSKRQAEASVLMDRQLLIEEVEEHLLDKFPSATRILPKGYLWALINESIKFALRFKLYDVANIIFFCDLRWSVSSGFFLQPALKDVLESDVPELQKVERLCSEELEHAWREAETLTGTQYWKYQAAELEQ